LTALGGFILLFGFIAFTAGFQGHISHRGDGYVVSLAIMNAVLGTYVHGSELPFSNHINLFHNFCTYLAQKKLGTCGGGLGALIIHRAGTFGLVKSWSFLMTLNGALAGMVGNRANRGLSQSNVQ
jgi:hypothetical protein